MSAEHSLGPVCMARIAPSIALVCLLAHMAAANSQTAGTKQRSHRATVTSSPFTYTVTVGGTMDGLNTRGPIGYQVFHQKFEPNIELILENVGDTIVRNPWIKIDGRGGRVDCGSGRKGGCRRRGDRKEGEKTREVNTDYGRC